MFSVTKGFQSFLQSPVHLNYGASVFRMLSMHTINDNLYLCTDKPRKIQVDKKSLRIVQTKHDKKPIVLMISWFNGQKSQLNKYSQLYTDQGLDVLVTQISIAQFLFKIKSVELLGNQLADFLVENEDQYPEIFFHMFSTGGGMWGISQRKQKQNPEKYDKIPERIIGQIWDSVTHPSKVIVAIPFAIFPKDFVFEWLTRSFLFVYFKLRKNLLVHYQDAIDNFLDHRATAPALFISSKADLIGTDEFSQSVVERWRRRNIDVTYKCFPDSQHVKHLQKYPEEYIKLVHEHWERVKLLDRK